MLSIDFCMISHNKIGEIHLHFSTTGDQSYEKKTLLSLLFARVGTSVQMCMLVLANCTLLLAGLLAKFKLSAVAENKNCRYCLMGRFDSPDMYTRKLETSESY